MSKKASSRAVETATALERFAVAKTTREANREMAKALHEIIKYLEGLKFSAESKVLVSDLFVEDTTRSQRSYVETFWAFLEERGFINASNANEVKSLTVASFLADLKGLEYSLNGGYEVQTDSATLDAARAECQTDAANVLGLSHSKENAALLNDHRREKEYEARLKTLNAEERRGCPPFADLMRPISEKNDDTFDALRARTKDLRFAVAVIYDGEGKIVAYRPGLIEAEAEPAFLRDTANSRDLIGEHYDRVYNDLTPHGLRSPNFPEYQALFAMRKQMEGVIIDTKGWTLCDMGERMDKRAGVPLASERDGRPSRGSGNPDRPDDHLVSRPSAWGANVLPKIA